MISEYSQFGEALHHSEKRTQRIIATKSPKTLLCKCYINNYTVKKI
jgi:hypothetical protein